MLEKLVSILSTAAARHLPMQSALTMNGSWYGIMGCSLHTSAPLLAEPLKKKKRLDPAILKAREDRRKRKIEKQIRRLEKVAQQYKPVDECEVSPTLRKEISMRKRNAPMSESELAEAAQLLCEWTRYRWKESCDELITIDSIVSSRLKALEELRKESPRLYEAAIQLDENLLPYKATGPVESPPIAGYDPPDGEYIDTTKKWT